MSGEFVHLRVHTEYSLVDSVIRVEELVDAVAAAEMPAVALTDQNNLFAMVKLYRAALERGIKPIVGVDLLVREAGERAQPSRLTLLCQSEIGYRNVTRLLSRAYLEGQQRGVALIDRRWLSAEGMRGLIALSCATEGDVGRALVNGREAEAERALQCWRTLLEDRFYLELQRVGRPGEEDYIAAAVALAARLAVPVVATNDVRFLRADDFEAHAAICSDADVMRYIRAGALTRVDAWWQMARYMGHWQLRGYGLWAVIERATGRLIGHIGFLNPEGGRGFELGWALARDSWGKGYAFEGVQAAVHYAFTELHRDHILCIIRPDNTRSVRLAERLGARLEREETESGALLVYRINPSSRE